MAIALCAPAEAQQLSPEATRSFAEYRLLPPHRVFAVSPDGKVGQPWSGSGGADPATAIGNGLGRCEERSKAKCTLYAVNNVVLAGRDWKSVSPPSLPPIGRLRAQP